MWRWLFRLNASSLRVYQDQSRPLSPSSQMYAQRLARKHVVCAHRVASRAQQFRRLATAPPPPETPQPNPSKPYRYEKAEQERSPVVQKIRANPIAFKIVQALGRVMGYGSTKQVAGRRTLAMYEQVCAVKASEDRVFWEEGEHFLLPCSLVPCRLIPGHLSLRSASNVPILVHHNQSSRLAPDRSAPCTLTATRHKPHSSLDRPLLPRCRRSNQGRSSTHRLRIPNPNRLLCTSVHPRLRLNPFRQETGPGT